VITIKETRNTKEKGRGRKKKTPEPTKSLAEKKMDHAERNHFIITLVGTAFGTLFILCILIFIYNVRKRYRARKERLKQSTEECKHLIEDNDDIELGTELEMASALHNPRTKPFDETREEPEL
jgi:flagellar biosynthesis/type III secretory pathway M-ring protein FliF/YscJ